MREREVQERLAEARARTDALEAKMKKDFREERTVQERLAEARARESAVEEKMRKDREDARRARAELAAAERAAAEAGVERTAAERKRAAADASYAAEQAATAERFFDAERTAAERSAVARTATERASVLERAEEGTLRVPPVLFRARSDTLVNPADTRDCRQLDNLLRTDENALYELLPAARQYVRFTELTQDNLDKGAKELIKRMLSDADIAQERITRQLDAIRIERMKRDCPAMR